MICGDRKRRGEKEPERSQFTETQRYPSHFIGANGFFFHNKLPQCLECINEAKLMSSFPVGGGVEGRRKQLFGYLPVVTGHFI